MGKYETIKDYTSVWKKLEASGTTLDECLTLTFNQFKAKTGYTSKGRFRLAKSLARNPSRQKQVNKRLDYTGSKIKRLPEMVPLKEPSEYGILEIIDNEGNSRWVKYKNKKDLDRQTDIVKKEYGKKKYTWHGVKGYAEFTAPEFQKELDKWGLE